MEEYHFDPASFETEDYYGQMQMSREDAQKLGVFSKNIAKLNGGTDYERTETRPRRRRVERLKDTYEESEEKLGYYPIRFAYRGDETDEQRAERDQLRQERKLMITMLTDEKAPMEEEDYRVRRVQRGKFYEQIGAMNDDEYDKRTREIIAGIETPYERKGAEELADKLLDDEDAQEVIFRETQEVWENEPEAKQSAEEVSDEGRKRLAVMAIDAFMKKFETAQDFREAEADFLEKVKELPDYDKYLADRQKALDRVSEVLYGRQEAYMRSAEALREKALEYAGENLPKANEAEEGARESVDSEKATSETSLGFAPSEEKNETLDEEVSRGEDKQENETLRTEMDRRSDEVLPEQDDGLSAAEKIEMEVFGRVLPYYKPLKAKRRLRAGGYSIGGHNAGGYARPSNPLKNTLVMVSEDIPKQEEALDSLAERSEEIIQRQELAELSSESKSWLTERMKRFLNNVKKPWAMIGNAKKSKEQTERHTVEYGGEHIVDLGLGPEVEMVGGLKNPGEKKYLSKFFKLAGERFGVYAYTENKDGMSVLPYIRYESGDKDKRWSWEPVKKYVRMIGGGIDWGKTRKLNRGELKVDGGSTFDRLVDAARTGQELPYDGETDLEAISLAEKREEMAGDVMDYSDWEDGDIIVGGVSERVDYW